MLQCTFAHGYLLLGLSVSEMTLDVLSGLLDLTLLNSAQIMDILSNSWPGFSITITMMNFLIVSQHNCQ